MEEQNEGNVYFYFTMHIYIYASTRVSHINLEHELKKHVLHNELWSFEESRAQWRRHNSFNKESVLNLYLF